MTSDEILAKIAEVMTAQFQIPSPEVTRASTAFDVPGWDSIQHVYFIIEIEKTFGLRLPTEKVMALADIGELTDLIQSMDQQEPA
jgi:acyl carrier protein